MAEAAEPEADMDVDSDALSPADDFGAAAVSREELSQDSREALLPQVPARAVDLQAELQVELSAPAYVAAEAAALPDPGLIEAEDTSGEEGQQEPAWQDEHLAITPAIEQEALGQDGGGRQLVHSSSEGAEWEDEGQGLSKQQALPDTQVS